MAFGVERDTWGAELFIENLNNESAPVMQIAGRYTPAITVQRQRTIGLRLSYDFELLSESTLQSWASAGPTDRVSNQSPHRLQATSWESVKS